MTMIGQLTLEFAYTKTGHALTDQPDLTDDGRIVDFVCVSDLFLLPEALPGKAEQSTKSIKAYFRVTFFEFFDCSASTFFDRSMPYSAFKIPIITS